MIRAPPQFTGTDTLFPYTPLSRAARSPATRTKSLVSASEAAAADCAMESALSSSPVASTAAMRTSVAADANGDPDSLVCNSRRSEEHTSELQSLMRISYAVFCLKKKKTTLALRIEHHKHNHK